MPTLNSRPAMYCCTTTSSNCSGHCGDARLETLLVGDNRLSIESRARILGCGFHDGGEREVVLDFPLRERPARHGKAGALEQRVGDGFAAAGRDGPRSRSRCTGMPAELQSVPTTWSSHCATPRTPSQRLNTRIGATARVEPAACRAGRECAEPGDREAEDCRDVVDGFHHPGDVFGGPVVGAGVVQDDDPHAGHRGRGG
mgnify:CR=1 FL=1